MELKNARSNKVLACVMGLCFAFIALIAAWVNTGYVDSTQMLVRRTTMKNIGELTVSKAQYLDEKIRQELLALQSLAASVGACGGVFSNGELVTQYMELHGATGMWIFDAAGNGWSAVPDGPAALPTEQDALFAAVLRGETGMSDVFLGAMGKRQVLYYTPIYREGRIAGGLYEAYPVEHLQNTYGGSTYNDAGYSYVLGADGSIVLAPVRFSYLQIYTNIREVLEYGENSRETVSEFMDALKSGAKGSAVFDFEGEAQLLSFTPLTAREGWLFVTVIPQKMVEKDGARIIDLTVRMAVIIILAIVAALILLLATFYWRYKKHREYDGYIRSIYQAISQNIDTVIFIVDAKTGRVEYTFDNAREVLGIPPQAFSRGDGEGAFQRELSALLRERPEEKVMWERSFYNDALGRQMWLEVTSLPVTLRGAPKYIFAAADVTQDRQIREKLNDAVTAAEQANAAKSRFLSSMSHDIRTPLNAIIGMNRLAELHIGERDRVEDCLRKIDISSKHLLSLINDVLDMSKIESGKMALSEEPLFLGELLEGGAAIVQPQCDSKGQTFAVETKHIRHEYLLGDSLRLNQVFLNLTSNAVKFTPEGGSVTFSVEELPQRRPGYAVFRFRVADSGIGIAPEFLPSVFTPFERERTSTVGKTEGTGLGLAIAKNIVDAMGGQISVESRLGEGTTFTVELELAMQEPEQAACRAGREAPAAGFDCAGRRFLLAEDNEINREIATELLREYGARVEAAEDGKRALERFSNAAPGYYDAILMDIQMPVMDGYAAARAIRAGAHPQAKTIPIIAMTANAFAEDIHAAKAAGMNGHVAKPIDPQALLRTLGKCLQDRGQP